MEKRTPHYRLIDAHAAAADLSANPFSTLARLGGVELGLSVPQMRAIVLGLTSKSFYKSMTTYVDHTVWQDVYIGETAGGIEVYIKITQRAGSPPIIQFKRK